MQLDKAKAIDNARKFALLVVQQYNPIKIVLFGSLAKDTFSNYSDIDIAVIVDKVPEDFLNAAKNLNKLTRNIDNRIEPLFLEQDDDRSGFLSTILSTGITLFERPVA